METVMNSSFILPTNVNIDGATLWKVGLPIIVLVVVLPLNIYVLWLLVTDSKNGLTSEFFPINLCVCEIIICSDAMCNLLYISRHENNENGPLYFFTTFLLITYNISRPFFQCCVCVERYVAVSHPIFFRKYKPLRYRTALSVITWILVLAISVFCPFLELRNRLYCILLPVYLLVFAIKIICSLAVLKALRKPGPGEKLCAKDAESNRVKKKAFCVIVIILVFMFITYCPMMILLFVYDSISRTQKTVCLAIFHYFMIFAGFVHPFLYLQRVGKLSFIPGL